MREIMRRVPMNEARGVPDDQQKSPDDVIELKELRAKFQMALKKLNTDRQREIAMAIFDGIADNKNLKEIAESCGLSNASVVDVWYQVCRLREFKFMPKKILLLRKSVYATDRVERKHKGKVVGYSSESFDTLYTVWSELDRKKKLNPEEAEELWFFDRIMKADYEGIDDIIWHFRSPEWGKESSSKVFARILKKYGVQIDIKDEKWREAFFKYKTQRVAEKQ